MNSLFKELCRTPNMPVNTVTNKSVVSRYSTTVWPPLPLNILRKTGFVIFASVTAVTRGVKTRLLKNR